eukprot:TRINITY_DN2140_c0_g1_i1.p1 TRINITY_DN2140_c0_g1~~TRINITY_DN2140_c0_g1_i1.p1  ORF type:complete len:229 (-),score=38.74 TRINITY_DN2140_c0_g1_i1:256-942(-)
MRLVGGTGGIASGKSSVCAQLQSLGIPVIDADKIAHEALRNGTWGHQRVVATFGAEILDRDGQVNRNRLGEIIFNDAAKRKLLNKAMEPPIALGILLQVFKHWITGTRVVVLDVPLLFEAGINKVVKTVIVVWVDGPTQEARLMSRDACSKEQAHAKIQAQLSLDWKARQADMVISNDTTVDATLAQVHQAWKHINAPLTWTEHLLTRRAAAVASLVVGAALYLWWRK